ncbi:MAG: AMP-binding protein [bacterium]|nr:AMP-binding protein [bacterium]
MPPLRSTRPPARAAAWRASGAWRDETLWEAFAATVARAPACTALIEDAHRLDFATLAARAERLAAGLAARGIGAGDVVAFQLPNWWETVVVFFAAARLGATAQPVLPIAGAHELRFMLRQSGARALFVPGRWRDVDHRALVATVRADLPALAHVVVVRDAPSAAMETWDVVAAGVAVAPSPPHDPDAVALLIYTSGTTAEPKGVLHTHATLLAEAHSLGPVHGLAPGDVTLMPSPLTHVSGIVHAMLVPAALGTTAVLMPRWDPARALALIAAEHVTYMVGAPTFLRDLASHPALADTDVTSFRLFSCGGADVDPALVAEAAARLGCVAKRVYGSTEFPTITTTAPDDPPARRVDSEGRAIGAAEMRVVDEDGAPVAAGAEGEVVAVGPECFLGYLDATANAEAFTPDGWFRTGDLGVADADGFLRITGRKKDILIRKGENVSAREVEELLVTHPAVAEAALVGVPDAAAGELIGAVLRLHPGAPSPTLAELATHLLARGLSKRKLPERLAIVDAFPRTASGKIVKRALRDGPWR